MSASNNQGKINETKESVLDHETDVETTPTFLSAAVCALRPEPSPFNSDHHLRHRDGFVESTKVKPPPEDTGIPSWVCIDDIPLVDIDYYRSRTVFEIDDPARSDFFKNVMTCMKMRALHVVFEGATANCKTSSYMKFTIRLLRKNKDSNVILVDVRRKDGCAIEFRDEYQAIYHAAVHGAMVSPSSSRLTIPIDGLVPLVPLEEGSIERSLDRSMKNIESCNHDVYVLALQDLASLTKPSSPETYKLASKLLIAKDGKYSRIFLKIIDDVLKKVTRIEDNGEDDTEEFLRGLALSILGNILSYLKEEKSISLLINGEHSKEYDHDAVVEALVWYVMNARDCPWNACFAAKCLGLLRQIIPQSLFSIVEPHLETAEKIGQRSNDLLAKECRAALDAY